MIHDDDDVVIGFQIRDHGYEGEERDFLGVFTCLDRLEEVVDEMKPEELDGTTICYYLAEIDALGSESQWEILKDFPGPTDEEMRARAEKAEVDRQARIKRNRKKIFGTNYAALEGCPYCGGGEHPEHEHKPGDDAVCGVNGCECVGGH